MTHRFADIAFTESVRSIQAAYGSREHNERLQQNWGPNDMLTDREVDYIRARDTFYIATVNEDGWPYVQHRGGPAGFLQVLGPRELAYADFRGNRQLITTGNVLRNSRCSLILMDYPNRRRLKILGRLRIEDVDGIEPALRARIEVPGYRARVERIAFIDVAAFDWNCPQHIMPRFTEAEYAEHASRRKDRNDGDL